MTPAIGVMLPRDLEARRVLDFARLADRLGFDELWVVEDLGFRGGVAQAAAVLAATDRIRVGVGILPAAARLPAYAAMEAATLAQLFPGRVDIGIGHGMPGWLRSVDAWPAKPLAALERHVEEVRALLDGRAAGDGGATLDPSAVPGTPPALLLGVRGPKSLALAGRIADGTVLAEPSTPEYVRAARERIAAPGPHRIVTYDVAAVAEESAEAVAAARPALEWIGEPDWAPHIAPLDFAEEFAALRTASADRLDFVRRLPDEWVARLALAGTADEVRAAIAARAEAGATSTVLLPVGADPFASAEALAAVLTVR